MKKCLQTFIFCLVAVLIFSSFGFVVNAERNYVSGYTITSCVIREKPDSSSRNIGTLSAFTFIYGYREGNWISVNEGYIYDFGLVKGDYVKERAPSSINVRNKPNGQIVGRINTLARVEGIKQKGSNWIAIGPNRWVYDLNITNPQYVSGRILASVNVRNLDSGEIVSRYSKGDYVFGDKVGNYIVDPYNNTYFYNFGLVKGDYVKERTPSSINVRNKPNGQIVGRISTLGKVEGVKQEGSNWIAIGPNQWVYDLNITNPQYVSGRILSSVNVRNLDSGKIVDRHSKGDFVFGDKVGNYIVDPYNNTYFYNFGLIKGDYVNERAPSSINVRNKPNGQIVGRINTLGKVEGIKQDGSNWIAIGPNKWVYDLNITNPPFVSGHIQRSVNVRKLDSGEIVDRYRAGDFVVGYRVGNYLVNKYYNTYFYNFGLY